jgi:hypothetical protein
MPKGAIAPEKQRRPAKRSELWSGWDRGNFPVDDPVGLAELLYVAFEQRFPLEWDGRGKSTVIDEAAEEIGVSYSSLWRLIHAESRVLRWDVVTRLHRWLTSEEWKTAERHLFSSQVRRKRREYLAYLDREIVRYRSRRNHKHNITFSSAIQTVVDQFAKTAKPFPYTRVELAKLRVFDPVIGWRGLQQTLNENDLLGLVKQGFKREATLLRKEAQYLEPILGTTKQGRAGK